VKYLVEWSENKMRYLGIVVKKETVIAIDGSLTDLGKIVINGRNKWDLQTGERSLAYAIMFKNVQDYITQNSIQRVVIKESALSGKGGAKKGMLFAAELRGVVMAASARVVEVRTISKSSISHKYGNRKVDQYLKDDQFWDDCIDGDLNKGDREAALLILADRKI
jgi:hypothetical protein